MKIKSVSERSSRSMASGVGMGVLVSISLSVLLAMAIAALIENERINEEGIQYITLIITLISAISGGIVAGKKVGGKYALAAGITGLVYCLVLIGVGILLFDGGFRGLWTSVSSIAAGVAASCVFCMTRSWGKGKRKRFAR